MMKYIRAALMPLARSIYQHSDEYTLSSLMMNQPDAPRFFRPSADLGLSIRLHQITHFEAKDETVKLHLRKAFNIECITEEEFDFRKISALCTSSSFGKKLGREHSASWFEDLRHWGLSMYDDHHLSGETYADYLENIAHVEKELFRHHPIHVQFFTWENRYVFFNDGGSHHAAMLAAQLHRSPTLKYTKSVCIDEYSIDRKPIDELEKPGYLLFVCGSEYAGPESGLTPGTFGYLLEDLLGRDNVSYGDLAKESPNKTQLFIIDLNRIAMKKTVINAWINMLVKMGKVVKFGDFIDDPMRYATQVYDDECYRIQIPNPSTYLRTPLDPLMENTNKVV